MKQVAQGKPSIASAGDPQAATHLVVLVHGVGGSAANWDYLKGVLQKELGHEVLVFCSASVQIPTLGVDALGKKLADEVIEVVKCHQNLKEISIIAHSLGGLVARYAIALLLDPIKSYDTKVTSTNKSSFVFDQAQLEDAQTEVVQEPGSLSSVEAQSTQRTIAGLIPINFITLASPHLGSRGKAAVPFLSIAGFLEKASPVMGPWILGQTAKHLLLSDSPEPLLLQMTKDSKVGAFISALKAFKTHILYSNVSGDQLVGWQTSSIRKLSDMPKPDLLKSDPLYKYLLIPPVEQERKAQDVGDKGPIRNTATAANSLRKAHSDFFTKSQASTGYLDSRLEDLMAQNLSTINWTRVDVSFSTLRVGFLAHNLIQVKEYWIHKAGESIIQHLIDHFER